MDPENDEAFCDNPLLIGSLFLTPATLVGVEQIPLRDNPLLIGSLFLTPWPNDRYTVDTGR